MNFPTDTTFELDKKSSLYDMLNDHIESDIVDIYTISAILIKDYENTDGCIYETIKAGVCFLLQTLLPILVIYDSIQSMVDDNESIGLNVCPKTGTWQDRTASSIMSMFLTIFYISTWIPFTYRFFQKYEFTPESPQHRVAGILELLFNRHLNAYMSESMFVFGVLAKIMVHCLNTITCIIVIFQTVGTINIVVNACAIYYLNDISRLLVDDYIKEKCKFYLASRHLRIKDEIVLGISQENITTQVDYCFGTTCAGLIILFFPFFGIIVLFSTLGAIVFMPICHP